MRRRTLLAGVSASAMIMGVNGIEGAAAVTGHDRGGPGHGDGTGRFDRPQPGFASDRTVLRPTRPERLGLDPVALERGWDAVVGYTKPQPTGHPLYPGAVLLYGHQGGIVPTRATGYARLYAHADGTLLPADERIATRTDTIYDLASVSKLFTSIVIMQQVEAGRIDLDQKVVRYLPEFAQGDDGVPGKTEITIRMLLTHTSGFPAFLPFWRDYPDPASRMHAVLTAKLVNAPGSTYLYSDLNLITLGELAHRLTGTTLDVLVAEGITGPLRMTDTGYNPDPSLKPRIAATEEETDPPRGMVWGEVHDENAWSFGGVAGHAGVFSTAQDLAILAQTMLDGGRYRGARVLGRDSVRQMITNENTKFPGDDHGLGFELNQRWYMGGLTGPRTAGHTGFTGTSLVIDFDSRSFVILLTNRVHPSRTWGSNNPARVAAAQGLAEALAVRPRSGRDAWFSGTADATTSTLTWTLPSAAPAGSELELDVFVDTEETDQLTVETSPDGTTWTGLSWQLDGTVVPGGFARSGVRRWQRASADLPAGSTAIRWTYVTDKALSGRGIYLDDLRVRSGRHPVADAEHHPEQIAVTGGWHLARR